MSFYPLSSLLQKIKIKVNKANNSSFTKRLLFYSPSSGTSIRIVQSYCKDIQQVATIVAAAVAAAVKLTRSDAEVKLTYSINRAKLMT